MRRQTENCTTVSTVAAKPEGTEPRVLRYRLLVSYCVIDCGGRDHVTTLRRSTVLRLRVSDSLDGFVASLTFTTWSRVGLVTASDEK
jgi:hypothetical protein